MNWKCKGIHELRSEIQTNIQTGKQSEITTYIYIYIYTYTLLLLTIKQ